MVDPEKGPSKEESQEARSDLENPEQGTVEGGEFTDQQLEAEAGRLREQVGEKIEELPPEQQGRAREVLEKDDDLLSEEFLSAHPWAMKVMEKGGFVGMRPKEFTPSDLAAFCMATVGVRAGALIEDAWKGSPNLNRIADKFKLGSLREKIGGKKEEEQE